MKRMLFVSNIAKTGVSINFFGSSMRASKNLNMDFYAVANRSSSTSKENEAEEKEYGIHLLHADISRSPFSLSNYRAYKQITEIIKKYDIDYIHCNTPVGGILGRLAGKKCKVSRVIYQAHGFHFYKGAPLRNWLFYYPAERILARLTDTLITINREDYETAQKFHLRNNGKVYYVPGVGINLEKYKKDTSGRENKRRDMGAENKVVFISMGDLIARKNYETVIRAFAKSGCKEAVYWICGTGPLEDRLRKLAQELSVSEQICFLGFRKDIAELLSAADVFVLSSYQEGLPRSTSEAMAVGLPCLLSDVRGNEDLVENGKGGLLYRPTDVTGFAEGIRELTGNPEMRKAMSEYNLTRIRQFDIPTVVTELEKVYKEELLETGINAIKL